MKESRSLDSLKVHKLAQSNFNDIVLIKAGASCYRAFYETSLTCFCQALTDFCNIILISC
jgi:hypothetical protein